MIRGTCWCQGVEELLNLIRGAITVPKRNPDGPLLFAIDHCFPIKGQGTVLTGTVLSGSLKVGQEMEFPELKLTRKVKSMQARSAHVPMSATHALADMHRAAFTALPTPSCLHLAACP